VGDSRGRSDSLLWGECAREQRTACDTRGVGSTNSLRSVLRAIASGNRRAGVRLLRHRPGPLIGTSPGACKHGEARGSAQVPTFGVSPRRSAHLPHGPADLRPDAREHPTADRRRGLGVRAEARWCALVYVDAAVTVRTPTGRDISEYVDNLQALADLGRRFVLDGELVAASGRAGDFYRLGPNLRSSSRRDITFVAFDLLVLDNDNLCNHPYSERRHLLEGLDLFGDGWCTIRALVGSPRVLLDACAELDVEGVVAKPVDSPYRPGVRSGGLLKLKTVDWKRGHAPRRHR